MSGSHFSDEQLILYALGALPIGEDTGFEAHLSRCIHCQLQVREACAAVDALLAAERLQPAPGTKEKLLELVRADLAAYPPQNGRAMASVLGLRRALQSIWARIWTG